MFASVVGGGNSRPPGQFSNANPSSAASSTTTSNVPAAATAMGAANSIGSLPPAISGQIQQQTNPSINYAFVLANQSNSSNLQPPVQQGQICFVESSTYPGGGSLADHKRNNKRLSGGPSQQVVRATGIQTMNHFLAFYEPASTVLKPNSNEDQNIQNWKNWLWGGKSLNDRMWEGLLKNSNGKKKPDDPDFKYEDPMQASSQSRQWQIEHASEFIDKRITDTTDLSTINGMNRSFAEKVGQSLDQGRKVRATLWVTPIGAAGASTNHDPSEPTAIGILSWVDDLQSPEEVRCALETGQTNTAAGAMLTSKAISATMAAPVVSNARDTALTYVCNINGQDTAFLTTDGNMFPASETLGTTSTRREERAVHGSSAAISSNQSTPVARNIDLAHSAYHNDEMRRALQRAGSISMQQNLLSVHLPVAFRVATGDAIDRSMDTDVDVCMPEHRDLLIHSLTRTESVRSITPTSVNAQQNEHDIDELTRVATRRDIQIETCTALPAGDMSGVCNSASKSANQLKTIIENTHPGAGAELKYFKNGALNIVFSSNAFTRKIDRNAMTQSGINTSIFPKSVDGRNDYYLATEPSMIVAGEVNSKNYVFDVTHSYLSQRDVINSFVQKNTAPSRLTVALGGASVTVSTLTGDPPSIESFDELNADPTNTYIGYECFAKGSTPNANSIDAAVMTTAVDVGGKMDRLLPLEIFEMPNSFALPTTAYAPMESNTETVGWLDLSAAVHSACAESRLVAKSTRALFSANVGTEQTKALACGENLQQTGVNESDPSRLSPQQTTAVLERMDATLLHATAHMEAIVIPLANNINATFSMSDATFARNVLLPISEKQAKVNAWTQNMLGAKGRYAWRSTLRVSGSNSNQHVLANGARTQIHALTGTQCAFAGSFPPCDENDPTQWSPVDMSCDVSRFSGFYVPKDGSQLHTENKEWMSVNPGNFAYVKSDKFPTEDSARSFIASMQTKRTLSAADKTKISKLVGTVPNIVECTNGKANDVSTALRGQFVEAFSRRSSRSGMSVTPNGLFAASPANVSLTLVNSSPSIKQAADDIILAHSMLATVRSDSFLRACWHTTYNFGNIGTDITFGNACAKIMAQAVEKALSENQTAAALGFTREEFDAADCNTRMLLSTEAGRAIRFNSIEEAISILEKEPNSKVAQSAALLRAGHTVTGLATLNIYANSTYPTTASRARTLESASCPETQKLITMLRKRDIQVEGLGNDQACTAARSSGEFQYFLTTPEERAWIAMKKPPALDQLTDVGRVLPLGGVTTVGPNTGTVAFAATYGGISTDRFAANGRMHGSQEGDTIDVTSAYNYEDDNVIKNAVHAAKNAGTGIIPVTDLLVAFSPCTAPGYSGSISGEALDSALVKGATKNVRAEVLEPWAADYATKFVHADENDIANMCVGYYGMRILKQQAVAVCNEANAVARAAGTRPDAINPIDMQRTPNSHSMGPRIAMVRDMCTAYCGAVQEYNATHAQLALTTPCLAHALAADESVVEQVRAMQIALNARQHPVTEQEGAIQPALITNSHTIALEHRAITAQLYDVICDANNEHPRVDAAYNQLSTSEILRDGFAGVTSFSTMAEEISLYNDSNILNSEHFHTKMQEFLPRWEALLLENDKTHLTSDKLCARGLYNSGAAPGQDTVDAMRICTNKELSSKQALATAARTVVSYAVALSEHLYTLSNENPLVTARQLSGFNRVDIPVAGHPVAQGDIANALDATVAKATLQTLIGVAQIGQNKPFGILVASGILQTIAKTPDLRTQLAAVTANTLVEFNDTNNSNNSMHSLLNCLYTIASAESIFVESKKSSIAIAALTKNANASWNDTADEFESNLLSKQLHAFPVAVQEATAGANSHNTHNVAANPATAVRHVIRHNQWSQDSPNRTQAMLSLIFARASQAALGTAAALMQPTTTPVSPDAAGETWWQHGAINSIAHAIHTPESKQTLINAITTGAGLDIFVPTPNTRATSQEIVAYYRATKGFLVQQAHRLCTSGIDFGVAFALCAANPTYSLGSDQLRAVGLVAPTAGTTHTSDAVASRRNPDVVTNVLASDGSVMHTRELGAYSLIAVAQNYNTTVNRASQAVNSFASLQHGSTVGTRVLLDTKNGASHKLSRSSVLVPCNIPTAAEISASLINERSPGETTRFSAAIHAMSDVALNCITTCQFPTRSVNGIKLPSRREQHRDRIRGTVLSVCDLPPAVQICTSRQWNSKVNGLLESSIASALENTDTIQIASRNTENASILVNRSTVDMDDSAMNIDKPLRVHRDDTGVVNDFTGARLGDEHGQYVAMTRSYADLCTMQAISEMAAKTAESNPDMSDDQIAASVVPFMATEAQFCCNQSTVPTQADYIWVCNGEDVATKTEYSVRSNSWPANTGYNAINALSTHASHLHPSKSMFSSLRTCSSNAMETTSCTKFLLEMSKSITGQKHGIFSETLGSTGSDDNTLVTAIVNTLVCSTKNINTFTKAEFMRASSMYASGVANTLIKPTKNTQIGAEVAQSTVSSLGLAPTQPRKSFFETAMATAPNSIVSQHTFNVVQQCLNKNADEQFASTATLILNHASKTPVLPFMEAIGNIAFPRIGLAIAAGLGNAQLSMSDKFITNTPFGRLWHRISAPVLDTREMRGVQSIISRAQNALCGPGNTKSSQVRLIDMHIKRLFDQTLSSAEMHQFSRVDSVEMAARLNQAECIRDVACLLGIRSQDIPRGTMQELASRFVAAADTLTTTSLDRGLCEEMIYDLLLNIDHRSEITMTNASNDAISSMSAVMCGTQTVADALLTVLSQINMETKELEAKIACTAVTTCMRLSNHAANGISARINTQPLKNVSADTGPEFAALSWLMSSARNANLGTDVKERDQIAKHALKSLETVANQFSPAGVCVPKLVSIFANFDDPLQRLGNQTDGTVVKAIEQSQDHASDIVKQMTPDASDSARQIQRTATLVMACVARLAKDGNKECASLLGIDNTVRSTASRIDRVVENASTHFQQGFETKQQFSAWVDKNNMANSMHAQGFDADDAGKYYRQLQITSTYSEAIAVKINSNNETAHVMASYMKTAAHITESLAASAQAGSLDQCTRVCLDLLADARQENVDKSMEQLRQLVEFPSVRDVKQFARKQAENCTNKLQNIVLTSPLIQPVTSVEAAKTILPCGARQATLLARLGTHNTSVATPVPPIRVVKNAESGSHILVITMAGFTFPVADDTPPCLGPMASAADMASPCAVVVQTAFSTLAGIHCAIRSATETVQVMSPMLDPASCRAALSACLTSEPSHDRHRAHDAEQDKEQCSAACLLSIGCVVASPLLFGTTVANPAEYQHAQSFFLPLEPSVAKKHITAIAKPQTISTILCRNQTPYYELWNMPGACNNDAMALCLRRPVVDASSSRAMQDDALACDLAIAACIALAATIAGNEISHKAYGDAISGAIVGIDTAVCGARSAMSCIRGGTTTSYLQKTIMRAPLVTTELSNTLTKQMLTSALRGPAQNEDGLKINAYINAWSQTGALVFTKQTVATPTDYYSTKGIGGNATAGILLDATLDVRESGLHSPLTQHQISTSVAENYGDHDTLAEHARAVDATSERIRAMYSRAYNLGGILDVIAQAGTIARAVLLAPNHTQQNIHAHVTSPQLENVHTNHLTIDSFHEKFKTQTGFELRNYSSFDTRVKTLRQLARARPLTETPIEPYENALYATSTLLPRIWGPMGIVQRQIDSNIHDVGLASAPVAPLANVTVKGFTRTFNIWGQDVVPGDHLWLLYARVNGKTVRNLYKDQSATNKFSSSHFKPASGSLFATEFRNTLGLMFQDTDKQTRETYWEEFPYQIFAVHTKSNNAEKEFGTFMDHLLGSIPSTQHTGGTSRNKRQRTNTQMYPRGAARQTSNDDVYLNDYARLANSMVCFNIGRCSASSSGFISESMKMEALFSVDKYVRLPMLEMQLAVHFPIQPCVNIMQKRYAGTVTATTFLDNMRKNDYKEIKLNPKSKHDEALEGNLSNPEVRRLALKKISDIEISLGIDKVALNAMAKEEQYDNQYQYAVGMLQVCQDKIDMATTLKLPDIATNLRMLKTRFQTEVDSSTRLHNISQLLIAFVNNFQANVAAYNQTSALSKTIEVDNLTDMDNTEDRQLMENFWVFLQEAYKMFPQADPPDVEDILKEVPTIVRTAAGVVSSLANLDNYDDFTINKDNLRPTEGEVTGDVNATTITRIKVLDKKIFALYTWSVLYQRNWLQYFLAMIDYYAEDFRAGMNSATNPNPAP